MIIIDFAWITLSKFFYVSYLYFKEL